MGHEINLITFSGSLPIARAEDDIDEEAADEDVDVDGDEGKCITSNRSYFTHSVFLNTICGLQMFGLRVVDLIRCHVFSSAGGFVLRQCWIFIR